MRTRTCGSVTYLVAAKRTTRAQAGLFWGLGFGVWGVVSLTSAFKFAGAASAAGPSICGCAPKPPNPALPHVLLSVRPPCCACARAATSTHWHGLYLPNASWADGVAGISQAPVAPGGTFRYRFRAEPAGTFWYHAHTRLQYADGLRGPLIVRDPNDPYKGAYDEERLLMVYDQADVPAEEEYAALEEASLAQPWGFGGGGGANSTGTSMAVTALGQPCVGNRLQRTTKH